MVTLPRPYASSFTEPLEGWRDHPGGDHFPTWQTTTPTTPAVGYHTKIALADETINLVGTGLDSATFQLWFEGKVDTIVPLRTATDRAQITLPNDMPPSVCLIWPYKSSIYGYPIIVNKPSINWIWPGKKWEGMEDRTITIMGYNLSLQEIGPPFVIFNKDGNNTSELLEVVTYDSYVIIAKLPEDYTSGDYLIQVHNGTGGEYGYSNIEGFEVAVNPYDVSEQLQVLDYSGATFHDKLLAAIADARSLGGATINIPTGSYTITASIMVPYEAQGEPPIKITGDSSGETILTSATEVFINLCGAGSSFEYIKTSKVSLKIRVNDIIIDNCNLISANHQIENYQNLTTGGIVTKQNINLQVTNTTMETTNCCAHLTWHASYIRFYNCNFIGKYYNGYLAGTNSDNDGINSRLSYKVLIDSCRFYSKDAINGQILTRGILNWYTEANHTYINNDFSWIGAFPATIARETNTGEVICFHGVDVGVEGYCDDSSTATTCRIDLLYADFIAYNFLTYATDYIAKGLIEAVVLSGRAMGLYRTVLSAANSSTSTLLTVADWGPVKPQIGDKICIRPVFKNHLIVNNLIDSVPEIYDTEVDFARVGVLFWSPSTNCIVANNTIKHTQNGVWIQSTNGHTGWVQGDNYVLNNNISDCLQTGAYPLYDKFFADATNGIVEIEDQFFAIGNIFRGNKCHDAGTAVLVGTVEHDQVALSYGRDDSLHTQTSTNGVIMTIVENNWFNDIYDECYRISLAANWTLIRNNRTNEDQAIDFYIVNKTTGVLLKYN